jgi:hypothetical protein
MAAVQSAKAANPSYTVVTTGHSLGGSVATLAAAYLRKAGLPVDLYTYGSPRVGNDKFATYVSEQAGSEYRLTHINDAVPKLPPMFLGYRHTTPEYWLSTGASTTVDYTVSDIKVCEGTASVGCNAGTLGLDIDAHGYYLHQVGACSPEGIEFRQQEISDADLEARLNMYTEMDIEYAATLAASSGA